MLFLENLTLTSIDRQSSVFYSCGFVFIFGTHTNPTIRRIYYTTKGVIVKTTSIADLRSDCCLHLNFNKCRFLHFWVAAVTTTTSRVGMLFYAISRFDCVTFLTFIEKIKIPSQIPSSAAVQDQFEDVGELLITRCPLIMQ